jgi:hypothetical protein
MNSKELRQIRDAVAVELRTIKDDIKTLKRQTKKKSERFNPNEGTIMRIYTDH